LCRCKGAAERDQREASGGIDDVPEARRHHDAGEPDNKAQHQGCPDMPKAGLGQ
jgi:hypothetical protein